MQYSCTGCALKGSIGENDNPHSFPAVNLKKSAEVLDSDFVSYVVKGGVFKRVPYSVPFQVNGKNDGVNHCFARYYGAVGKFNNWGDFRAAGSRKTGG